MASLFPGEPAPHFNAPSLVNPNFAFNSLGGRYVLLAFMPPPGPERDAATDLVGPNLALFADGMKCIFYGVLPDTDSFDGVFRRVDRRR